MANNDRRSRGFTKKADPNSKSEANYGWRGAKDSFQSKSGGGSPFRKKEVSESIGAEAKIKPSGLGSQQQSYDSYSSSSSAMSSVNYGSQGQTSGLGDSAYSNNSVLNYAPETDNSYQGMLGHSSDPGSTPTKLGHININNINMDKVSINSTYNGKAHVGAANVLSNSEYMNLKSRMTFDPGSKYMAGIKVNQNGPDNLRVRFNDQIGLSESTVTQNNLVSVNQKLNAENIQLDRLSTSELQTLAKSGMVGGKRINLSGAEMQTVKAFATAKENPNSFTTLKGVNTIGGFRRTPREVKEAAKLKNIKFSTDSSNVINNGRVRVIKEDKTFGSPESGTSRIKFISDLEQRRSFLNSTDKIRVTGKEGEALKRSASGIKLTENPIVKNFRTGNIMVNERGTKLKFFGGNTKSAATGLGKGAVDSVKSAVGEGSSVFSKYAGAMKFTGTIEGIGSGLSGGLSNLANVFSSGSSILTGPIAMITAVVTLLCAFMSVGDGVTQLLLPTNNVQYTEDAELAGADAPESTLQSIIDELYYLQRAYEYNLVYADRVTKDPITGRLYIKEGLPDSWHEKIKALETDKPSNIPDMFDSGTKAGIFVNNHTKHEDAGATVTDVYYMGKLMGHRLKHFWGPTTCLYPATKNLEYDGTTADGHNDNRITVWSWEYVQDSNTGLWYLKLVPHEERMQLFCVGGLYGDAGSYSSKGVQHVKHSSQAYDRLKKKEEGYSTSNAGSKNIVNQNITVEYRYKGSQFSYLFTDWHYEGHNFDDQVEGKAGYYFTSDKVAVTYDTYEFYRALISSGMSYIDNGEENYKFLNEYCTNLFYKVMDNASITIEPGYDGAWFKADPHKRIYWDYVDPIGEAEGMPGKNDYYPNGLSKCSAPSYNCKAKIVITINDTGLQDMMKLDDTDNPKAHAKTFIERLVEAVKNFISKFKKKDDDEEGSVRKFLIDNDQSPHYNQWDDWYHDDKDGREFEKVTPFFKSSKLEQNTSQMEYAVMLTDMSKTDFNEFFEGIKLPTSSNIVDIVEDEPEIAEEEFGEMNGAVDRPTIKDGGVYLNNLCYINQGSEPLRGKTRYIDDEGKIHTFAACGCLDSSIMMIYLHYYKQNAESTTAAEVVSLWETYFKNYVQNGSGSLETSTVISMLGLTASGANYVKQCGWDKAIDSLYMGDPVLLHIRGYWEYGGDVLHKSSNGHFLIAVGADEDGLYVLDPGRRANNAKCIPWEAWNSVNDLYYKIYHASGATVGNLGGTNGLRLPYSLQGIYGTTMNIPNPGQLISVTEINTQAQYSLERMGTDAYSMQGTMLDASSKGWWAYDRIMNAAATATSNNIGAEGQLLTLQKNGQTYYVASIVDGFSKPGSTYKVTLNNGQSFNVFSADVKSLNDAPGSGSQGQIDSSYGHGTIIGDKVQMNIVEFFDASTSTTSEHSSSAKNYDNSPVSNGTYVVSVEATGSF